jgi:hypothetical protein
MDPSLFPFMIFSSYSLAIKMGSVNVGMFPTIETNALHDWRQ